MEKSYALVTDGEFVVVKDGTLPHVESGPSPAQLVSAITNLVKFLAPSYTYSEWRPLHTGDINLFLFRIDSPSISEGGVPPGFLRVAVGDLQLESEALEDAVFQYFRDVCPVVLAAKGLSSKINSETLWQDLAMHKHSVTALRGKRERWKDQVQFIQQVFDELKDKYYTTTESPVVDVVSEDTPFVAQTVPDPNGIRIEINECLFLDMGMLRQAVTHEFIHWMLYLEGLDVAKHGEHFQEVADLINAVEGENYVTKYADDTVWRT